MTDEEAAENAVAGVRVPPPLLFGGALALGLGAGRLASGATYGTRMRRVLGTLSIGIGVAAGAAALAEIRRVGSSPSPFAPATALATDGVFRFTRNPAYFGATSIYIGIALLARSIPAFVMLPVALALLDRFVVDKEERYLDARFGDVYRRYRDGVPRWF
jgi:protein-S-isoprenylcysteine O-methyltransferase Ste14